MLDAPFKTKLKKKEAHVPHELMQEKITGFDNFV